MGERMCEGVVGNGGAWAVGEEDVGCEAMDEAMLALGRLGDGCLMVVDMVAEVS